MKFNELKTRSSPSAHRVGRGIAAGRGKTAGRGTKGQKARKSGGVRPGFEGGQMPLYMRVPKLRGFKSHRPAVEVVYTGQLDSLPKEVNNHNLFEAGLIASPHSLVKLLLKGEISKSHSVSLQRASASAIKAVEAAGGSFKAVAQVGRTKQADKIKPELKESA